MTNGTTSSSSQPNPLFLGRRDELAALDAALATASRDGAQVLVIGGEAGIGKSTLLKQFAARHGAAARHVSVRCSPYDFDSLQPVLRLIAGLDPERPAPTPTPSGPAATGPEQAEAQRAELFTALLTALLDRLGSEPTVAVIDDVHWGRPLLHQLLAFVVEELVARRLQHRVLLILVARVLPPPHPVASLLADLERHLDLPRLDLGALPADDMAELVTATAAPAGRPSPAYVDLVQRSARGNPLRAHAALRMLDQRRIGPDLRPSDRRAWGEIRLSPELADPVTAWIGALPPDVRRTLTAGALWSDELSVEELGPLVDLPPAVLQLHLQQAESIELLETDGRSHWFGHPSFRETVLSLADTVDLQGLHARAAQLLPGGTGGAEPIDDTTARRLGHHLLAAADLVPAADALTGLVAAGHAAHRAFSWTEAARYLEAARELAPDDLTAAARRAEVLVALGLAHYFDHDIEAAVEVLDEAIEAAAAAGLEALWAEALLAWLRITMVSRAEALARVAPDDRARRFLDTATDPTWRSLIRQALAERHITAGDTATGADLARRALSDAEASGNRTARAFALYAASFADHTDLDLDEALLGVQAARREADASGDWWVQDIMQARLALYLLTGGHIDDADDAARSAVDAAARRHEHSNQAIGNYVRSAAALLRGDFEAFDTLAARTRREADRSGYVLTDLWSAAATVLGHLYRGDPAAADQAANCWRDPIPSGLAALRAAPALIGLPAPVTLRRPRRSNQISIGFYAASVEAAICAGLSDGLDEAADLLELATANGFEYPAAWPTSLTRIRAELALARGDAAGARQLFAEAARRATEHGAQLELARVLAGTARLLHTHGDALNATPDDVVETAARARTLATLIGLDPRILRLEPAHPTDPAGVGTPAAVLVTDIVGSTALSRQLGDLAYFELVTAHFELVRTSLRRWSGREFSESGDGLLAWFEDVPSALAAAGEIRRRAREASGPLGIKVSLAAGPTLLRAGRPYGLLPSLACRLLDCARPGEVVLDATVAATLPPHLSVTERRMVDLRGIGPHPLSVLGPYPA